MKTQPLLHQRELAFVEGLFGREYQGGCAGLFGSWQAMKPCRFVRRTDAAPKLLLYAGGDLGIDPQSARVYFSRRHGGAETRRVRDAAHERIRPHRLPILGHLDGKILDAQFSQQTPCAESTCGEFLHAFRHRPVERLRFFGEQRRRIARAAQLGDERARREQVAQIHRQIRRIGSDERHPVNSSAGYFDRNANWRVVGPQRATARMPGMNSLWQSLASRAPGSVSGAFHGRHGCIALKELAGASILGGRLESLRGRSVVLAMREQLAAAVALVELDGIARRMVLCTPDLTPEQLAGVSVAAEADAVLQTVSVQPVPEDVERRASETTEWILLTSGTTAQPKLVMHSLESLAGALPRQSASARPMVWSTFYDLRRYGGLQIYLRAVLSGSPLVLSSAGESTREFLTRAAAAGVTHISGTPSHWRRALMSGDCALISPEYVRLSGEVADQTILDQLHAAWPHARIAHAFASTEAGVAFDVNDGRAGFPAELIGNPAGAIDLKVQDGTLWIRSGRTAARYIGASAAPIVSEDGFVDTGDMVELANGRFYFRGRKGGIINVGGMKVYPEEVESVLNADPRVRMSLVKARRNPITGSLVVAEVVLSESGNPIEAQAAEKVRDELLNACRRTLAAHKVPALLRFVPALELTAAGKLVRPGA